jgi:hypothetical protein|tara:strand:- start:201 stop:338 length:138 start_codon:yes stop_codon:yes gene_type:complete
MNKTQTTAGYVAVVGLCHTVMADKVQHLITVADAAVKVAPAAVAL